MGLTKREIGHLIGLTMADGFIDCKNNRVSIKFNKTEKDSAEYILSLLRKLPHTKRWIGVITKNNNTLGITDKYLYKICKEYNMKKTEYKQFITYKMKNECLAWKLGFVAGFWSGDGNLEKNKKNKGRKITVAQTDKILEKLLNKKMCLDFCKEIIESLGLSTTYQKIKANKNTKNGVIWDSGPGYKLNIAFKGNKNTASIFKNYFYLHNKQKEETLEKLVEIEEKINNKS